MENKDPQTDAQMATSGQHKEDLQPQPRSEKRGITQSDSQLDWRERFRKEFKFTITRIFREDGEIEIQVEKSWIESFIAEVEKLAEERGHWKGEMEGRLQGVKFGKDSLKTELIEKITAVHKKPAKVEGGLIYDQGFETGLMTAINIIKSA